MLGIWESLGDRAGGFLWIKVVLCILCENCMHFKREQLKYVF